MDALTIAAHAAALAEPIFPRPGWAGPEYRILEVDWSLIGKQRRLAIDMVPAVEISVREFLGGTRILL